MPLTDIKIRQAKPADKPIKLADTAGLYLEVKPSGSKLWRYRYRIAGRENRKRPAIPFLTALDQ
jgi:hypothetical protein